MNYILSYDITSDKLRLKVSKRLETLGCFRVQKSVFIGTDFSVKEIKVLKVSILSILNTKLKTDTDSFLCLPMTGNQRLEMWWLKPNPLPDFDFDWSTWI
jgi:CRISPR-associated endonuclease Cas2